MKSDLNLCVFLCWLLCFHWTRCIWMVLLETVYFFFHLSYPSRVLSEFS